MTLETPWGEGLRFLRLGLYWLLPFRPAPLLPMMGSGMSP